MLNTSVPPITWLPTGLSLPLESNILAGIFADMNTVFGGDMSQSLSSPQGQLAQAFATIVGFKNSDIAYVASQVDPDNAEGRFQDAIGRIYFLQRISGSGTIVQCTCVGLVNTLIPQGSLVRDNAGYIYASTADATIPASGSVVITFQCLTQGPIQVAAGGITQIYKQINGWDTVSNSSAGTPGVLVESRAAFEARRVASVGANSVNSVSAIWGALLKVANVAGVWVVDNPTSAAVNVGSTNYSLAANSIVASVYGGAAADIANAIYNKKPPAIPTVGNQTQTITDSTNVQAPPYPTYTIHYLEPAATPIHFSVTIASNPNLPSNIGQLVQNAILAVFNGNSQYSTQGPAQQMSFINAGAYYAAIYAISPYVNVSSLTVGTAASPTGTSVQMGIDQMPTLQASNITVTV